MMRQIDINGSLWIYPGLVLNPSINRTRSIKSIYRELSQSSPFRCYYKDAQYLTANPGQLIVSWRDVGIGSRQDRVEGSWVTRRNKRINYTFKIKLKFVFNIRSRSGLNYNSNLTITKIQIQIQSISLNCIFKMLTYNKVSKLKKQITALFR